jgi:hypothetical protein
MDMTLNRRTFLKASGLAGMTLAFAGGNTGAQMAAPELAYAADEEDKVTLIYTDEHINAKVVDTPYKKRKCTFRESESFAIDTKHNHMFMAKLGDQSGCKNRIAVFAAPLSATKLSQWKLVRVFENKWLGHANGMTAMPCNNGTKLIVATNSKTLKTIYIPDLKNPSKGLELGTWKCPFSSNGLAYDTQTGWVISRSGLGSKKGVHYNNAVVFRPPTTATSGNHKVTEYTKFRVEFPKVIDVPAGVFEKKATRFYPTKVAKQDIGFHDGYLYFCLAATKSGRYSYKKKSGKRVYRTARNAIIRWKIGSSKDIVKKYKSAKKKIQVYPTDQYIFDAAIDVKKQGYEMESLAFKGETMYLLTNESSGTIKNQYDRVRVFQP